MAMYDVPCLVGEDGYDVVGVKMLQHRVAHQDIPQGTHHAKYSGMGNVVKIKPPLVISEAEAERVMEVFEEVVELLS